MRIFEAPRFAKRISPTTGEYFFGYYDLQPFNRNLHLTHRVSFADRLHAKGDAAEIGVIDIDTRKYEKLADTLAWNFQQGAMLQWNPACDDEIIYNCTLSGDYAAAVMNIRTGAKRYLDRPVANISRDGKYALSINFARMYNFRPGYGYAEYADPFYYQKHSKDDGVFLTDMQTGKSRLVLSMEQIWELSHAHFGGRDEKMVINHITFNPDSGRFLLLARNFPEPGKRHDTLLLTCSRTGEDPYILSDYGVQSHYYWLDNERVIFYNDGKELACTRGWANTYILRDKTHEGEMIADGYFSFDNHMSFSPDGTLMLTDSYPDKNRMQRLLLYKPEDNACAEFGRFYSMPREIIDIRCDLHPRFDRTGRRISFDSTHEGVRGVYVIDISDIGEDFQR